MPRSVTPRKRSGADPSGPPSAIPTQPSDAEVAAITRVIRPWIPWEPDAATGVLCLVARTSAIVLIDLDNVRQRAADL